MDIYQLLKKDHSKVKDLFKKIKGKTKTAQEPQEDFFSEIEKELHMHMEGEEKLFYPALEHDETTREDILKSYEEHHVVKRIIEDMSKMSRDDEKWAAKLIVLKEIVTHHIKEEESSLFKKARKVLNKEQAQEMCNRFEEEKKNVYQMA
ncbi:MAG: Regulator of cell morphogenesis and NO signaling [Candidatus Jettenia ecosi]|uniref:Regulator of cell morphogenesis and NO signaling n=1 Tax=Candidatus Jettenia ecosi TaxID=2494326 RepID=A0A533QEG4_9BACT|nr:MAG: Regulator of cell morphogenesis and NO signaling [Candidatus Jettenia ecosi]